MLNLNRKEKNNMLNINFEFRKGIFFIRLMGEMTKDNFKLKEEELKKLIVENEFKYIVINTNYLNKVDLAGLNYILKICHITETSESNLVICDKHNIIKRLLNSNFPSIKDEMEVL